MPILIASPEGGMEIEEVAEKHPEKILTVPIELRWQCQTLLFARAWSSSWDGKEKLPERGCRSQQASPKLSSKQMPPFCEINPLVRIDRRKTLGARCQALRR